MRRERGNAVGERESGGRERERWERASAVRLLLTALAWLIY
jgi:hypothetical protein